VASDLARKMAAIDKLRRLTSKNPDKEPELAITLIELADGLKAAGRAPEAVARIREGKQIYQARVREWHHEEILVAACLSREATWLAEAGDAAAESLFAEEATIYLDLARSAQADKVMDRLRVLQDATQENLSAKRYRSAEGAARACIELAQRLVRQAPSAAETYLVNMHNSLVLSLGGQRRFAEAQYEAIRSVEIAKQAAARGQLNDREAMAMAFMLREWATQQGSRPDEAGGPS
jgi:hypothetical protein